ncbi:MAG: hypothetical protein PF439_07375 [Helicobacteraceae bacterium]|jgi:hypothetical protein|nr:hypothetical protein [Helicobacteraceae bacterium]
MFDLDELLEVLPQKDPVGFVKKVLVCEEHESRTLVRFESAPTLSMLSEAGAQTSIFLRLTEEKKAANVPTRAMGMLVSIKSKWLQKSDKTSFEVKSSYVNNLDSFFVVDFTVLDGEMTVAEGQIAAVLEQNGVAL